MYFVKCVLNGDDPEAPARASRPRPPRVQALDCCEASAIRRPSRSGRQINVRSGAGVARPRSRRGPAERAASG